MPHRPILLLAAVCHLLILAGCCPRVTTETQQKAGVPPLQGPYLGQTPPGDIPELFGPGLISTSLHDDCPAVFSPDGRDVYFRKWAVPHDIVGHMHRGDDGVWSAPELFRPDGDHVFLHPIFVPGTDLVLIEGFRPRDPTAETPERRGIWQVRREGERWLDWTWSELNFSTGASVWSVAADATVYLQAPSAKGRGRDFYAARRSADGWEAPLPLDIPLDGAGRMPCVAPDQSYLVYSLVGRNDGYGNNDLYASFRHNDGTWSDPLNLGAPVNSPYDEKFAALSPDGAYLFYVSTRAPDRRHTYLDLTYAELIDLNEGPGNGLGRGDVYWVSTRVITALGEP